MSKKLRLAGSAALLAWLAWRTDWRQVVEAFARLSWGWWLLATALYAAAQVVSSVRWQLMARPLGFRATTVQYTTFYFVGMFFNLVLPTSVGGDVVRAWYLARLDDGAGRRLPALLSVFAERLSGLAVLVLLACAAALVSPVELPPWLRVAIAAAGVGTAVGLGISPLVARWGECTRFARLSRLARDGQTYLGRPRLLLGTGLLSLAVQAANVAVVALIGHGLGLDVPAVYYAVMVPMVTLLTLLPVSVNGVGVREAGTVLLLAPAGVADGPAVSLALLWFLCFSAVGLAGVFFYLFGGLPRFEVRSHESTFGDHPGEGRAGQPRAAA